jgi:hypothetical protein
MHHASQLPARIPRLRSVVVGNVGSEVVSDDFSMPASGGGPVVLVATPGQTLVISTTLAGDPPFAHQWLRNGQAISGATGVGDCPRLQLTTAELTASDSGVQYSVVVGSAAGSLRSPVAVIYVSEVTRLAAGGAHFLALRKDGSAYTRGANAAG